MGGAGKARRPRDNHSNCPIFQQLKTGRLRQPAHAYTGALMEAWIDSLLALLALPQYGLSTVFLVSFVSATLLPLGSEPVVFGMVKLNPAMFWPVMLVATVGNTLGGGVSWGMGWASHSVVNKYRQSGNQLRAMNWLQRVGPKACLLSWLPGVGDPLCAVAGWLRLPFWPCMLYIAIGKFLRYVIMTAALLWVFPSAAAG